MNNYRHYNPNPSGHNVGDCTIRAINKATGQSWDAVYMALSAYGYRYHNMPSATMCGAISRASDYIAIPTLTTARPT